MLKNIFKRNKNQVKVRGFGLYPLSNLASNKYNPIY
jgi:hypothetical protein